MWLAGVLPAIPVDARESFGFAKPATDATGNTFGTYNPGRYDGVLVLIPTADGFEDIGWDDRSSGQHNFEMVAAVSHTGAIACAQIAPAAAGM